MVIFHFRKRIKKKRTTGDPRKAIEERYPNFDFYFNAYKRATENLVKQGYLLEEEVTGILELAVKNRGLIE